MLIQVGVRLKNELKIVFKLSIDRFRGQKVIKQILKKTFLIYTIDQRPGSMYDGSFPPRY